jgi:hypothetical protein
MSNIVRVGDSYDPAFESMELLEVQDNLEGIADNVSEGSYTKRLTPEEVQASEKQFAYLSIEIGEEEEKLADYVKAEKERIKLIKQEAGDELKKVKNKTEFVTGKLYEMFDQENRSATIVDERGVIIDVRPLRRDERQKTIFSITDATGTQGK